MGFEYGCFISHVGAKEKLMTEFIDSLVEALRSELEPYMDQQVFIDQQRMNRPVNIDPTLARAMCASACWFLVYVPQFWERTYCMRELQAMLDLEKSRRLELGNDLDERASMIIPIVLRGERDHLPANLGSTVHCLSFEKFSTADPDILRNSEYMAEIEEIAGYIDGIYRLGAKLSSDCAGFAMPEAGDDLGSPPPPQPFPGHSRNGRRTDG